MMEEQEPVPKVLAKKKEGKGKAIGLMTVDWKYD